MKMSREYDIDGAIGAVIDVLNVLACMAIENKHREELQQSIRGLRTISRRANLIVDLLDDVKTRKYPRLVQ